MSKKPDTRNYATRQRQQRQEELRELLSKQGHLQHVLDLCGKLSDESIEVDSVLHQRYKTVIDTKLKLLNKYLPDLKAVEHTGEAGGELTIKVTEYSTVQKNE